MDRDDCVLKEVTAGGQGQTSQAIWAHCTDLECSVRHLRALEDVLAGGERTLGVAQFLRDERARHGHLRGLLHELEGFRSSS